VASRALTSVIQSQFRSAWSRWGEIPPKRVERMFLKLGVSLSLFLAIQSCVKFFTLMFFCLFMLVLITEESCMAARG
jgi:hypothetical protein